MTSSGYVLRRTLTASSTTTSSNSTTSNTTSSNSNTSNTASSAQSIYFFPIEYYNYTENKEASTEGLCILSRIHLHKYS